ncbi:hypothetical protein MRX96_014700 [Rhipicephalus microplus]
MTPTETTDIPCSTKTLRSPHPTGATRPQSTQRHVSFVELACEQDDYDVTLPQHPSDSNLSPTDQGTLQKYGEVDCGHPPSDDHPLRHLLPFLLAREARQARASRDPDRDDWHRVFDEDPSIPSQPGPHDNSPPSDRRSSPSSSAAFPPRRRGQATRASRDPDRDDWHRVFDEDPSIPSQPGPHDHSPPSDRFRSLSWRVNKMTMTSPCHDTPWIRTCRLPTRECCGF